jgi:hypothetical protein
MMVPFLCCWQAALASQVSWHARSRRRLHSISQAAGFMAMVGGLYEQRRNASAAAQQKETESELDRQAPVRAAARTVGGRAAERERKV